MLIYVVIGVSATWAWMLFASWLWILAEVEKTTGTLELTGLLVAVEVAFGVWAGVEPFYENKHLAALSYGLSFPLRARLSFLFWNVFESVFVSEIKVGVW